MSPPPPTQAGEEWGVNLPSQVQQGGYQPNKGCDGCLAGNEPLLQGDEEGVSLQPSRNTTAPLGFALFLLYPRELIFAVMFHVPKISMRSVNRIPLANIL